MRIFRRALIFSTLFAQNFSTFGQNVSAFGEKCPTFSAPLHAALATRHKKRTAPQFIVQSFVFQSKHEAAFPLTSRGTRLLGCPCSRVKSLVHSFLCAFLGSSLGLGTDVLRVAFHDFGATLCSSFGFLAPSLRLVFGSLRTVFNGFRATLCSGFGLVLGSFCVVGYGLCAVFHSRLGAVFGSFHVGSSGFGVLLCGRFGFCSSFATDTFLASLLGHFHLFAGSSCGFLTLAGGLFGAFLTARLHFLLGSTGIRLDGLSRSGSAYRENGSESQTAKQRIQIKFHCPVVLVDSSVSNRGEFRQDSRCNLLQTSIFFSSTIANVARKLGESKSKRQITALNNIRWHCVAREVVRRRTTSLLSQNRWRG